MLSRTFFLLVVALITIGDASANDMPDPRQRAAVPVAGAPSIGPDDALVTIVEFSDFYCPYCRRANAVIGDLMRLYPDQIRLVFRHSLLDPDDASLAAEAAFAAAEQGRFWPFHDRMFAAPAPTDIDGLVAVAAEVGLDPAPLRRALASRAYRDRVLAEHRLSKTLGVGGIPHFFINGRPLSGAQPLGTFVRIIEEELAIAAELVAGGVPAKAVYGRLIRGAARGKQLMDAETLYASGIDPGAIKRPGLGRPSHRRGGEQPLVWIVEFSDFDCGYCARAHGTLESVLSSYGDEVSLSYRHFPLGATTKLVAEAAEAAAAQGKFWPFHDAVFSTPGRTDREALARHAATAGLDLERFSRDLDDRRFARAVALDTAEGAALGVTGTPTFFINGRPLVGAPTASVLRQVIDSELTAARELLKKGVDRADLYRALTSRSAAPEVAAPDEDSQDDEGIDPVDYQIAVLLACREGDADSAQRFYKEIKDRKRRAMVRADCKRLGVALPR